MAPPSAFTEIALLPPDVAIAWIHPEEGAAHVDVHLGCHGFHAGFVEARNGGLLVLHRRVNDDDVALDADAVDAQAGGLEAHDEGDGAGALGGHLEAVVVVVEVGG